MSMLASAVGWYGDRGDEQLTEDSTPGEGFLPDICREWEDAASTVEELGVRTVFLRTGIVLTATAGTWKDAVPFQDGSRRSNWKWKTMDVLDFS